MVFYPNPVNAGTDQVNSLGDGATISVSWFRAEHSLLNNRIAYNIYYSTIKDNVFSDGIKYVSIDETILQANLINLTPGQMYFIAVRPVEYNPSVFDLTQLPIAYDNLRFYPSSILRQDMGATDLIVPLLDVDTFPSTGIVQVGVELIRYSSVDSISNNLIIASGTNDQSASLVDLDGYGHFFKAGSTNTGDGYLVGLTAVPNSGAPTETWTIRCIFAGHDGYGNEIKQFSAIGTISGSPLNNDGDGYVWQINDGYVYDGYSFKHNGYIPIDGYNSNGILNFAIYEGSVPFILGDYFTVKVNGIIPGISSGRGYYNSTPRLHTVSGYDGDGYWNPTVVLFTLGEDYRWDLIYACQSRFEYPNYPYTVADGYHQVMKDILSTDLSAADAANINFPMYDYAGYHRTDPVQLLNGTCVGSYIGGEMGCIDANGNYNILRGFSLEDQNTQREDLKLSIDGEPAILIKRAQTGITCSCYLPSNEHPDDRCPICLGTKFVIGNNQYFNPRRSDGRILVRPSPTEENLKRYEAGMESEFPVEFWTLTVPTIKMRDILIIFDQDNNEEFRYEVAGVTRNKTILGLNGGQILKTYRIRKFDPAYQIRVFRDTSDFPTSVNTSISFVPGILPHLHAVQLSEKISSVSQINETTGISQGHSHQIVAGVVETVLGHSHEILL